MLNTLLERLFLFVGSMVLARMAARSTKEKAMLLRNQPNPPLAATVCTNDHIPPLEGLEGISLEQLKQIKREVDPDLQDTAEFLTHEYVPLASAIVSDDIQNYASTLTPADRCRLMEAYYNKNYVQELLYPGCTRIAARPITEIHSYINANFDIPLEEGRNTEIRTGAQLNPEVSVPSDISRSSHGQLPVETNETVERSITRKRKRDTEINIQNPDSCQVAGKRARTSLDLDVTNANWDNLDEMAEAAKNPAKMVEAATEPPIVTLPERCKDPLTVKDPVTGMTIGEGQLWGKVCRVNGNLYMSFKQAAAAENISVKQVKDLCWQKAENCSFVDANAPEIQAAKTQHQKLVQAKSNQGRFAQVEEVKKALNWEKGQVIPCIINGIEYRNIDNASKALSISHDMLNKFCASPLSEHKNYSFVSKAEASTVLDRIAEREKSRPNASQASASQATASQLSNQRWSNRIEKAKKALNWEKGEIVPCIIYGTEYESINQACKALKISNHKLNNLCASSSSEHKNYSFVPKAEASQVLDRIAEREKSKVRARLAERLAEREKSRSNASQARPLDHRPESLSTIRLRYREEQSRLAQLENESPVILQTDDGTILLEEAENGSTVLTSKSHACKQNRRQLRSSVATERVHRAQAETWGP